MPTINIIFYIAVLCVVLNCVNTDELSNSNEINENSEYEIIEVPENLFNRTKDVLLWKFYAFKTNIELKLVRNRGFLRNKNNFNGINLEKHTIDDKNKKTCHYIHADSISAVALSNCLENEIVSMILNY